MCEHTVSTQFSSPNWPCNWHSLKSVLLIIETIVFFCFFCSILAKKKIEIILNWLFSWSLDSSFTIRIYEYILMTNIIFESNSRFWTLLWPFYIIIYFLKYNIISLYYPDYTKYKKHRMNEHDNLSTMSAFYFIILVAIKFLIKKC